MNRILRSMFARYKLRRVPRLLQEGKYLDAYAVRTDALVDIDPKMAIGGNWDEAGKQQFDFLVSQGLEPSHSMLDIGCGTLRGGRKFIEYLDPGRYFGFDLSAKAIESGKLLVQQLGLAHKLPDLRTSDANGLRFKAYGGMSFDYLLAQSVFSHLKEHDISECFANVGNVMHTGSKFYFTYHPGPTMRSRGKFDFEYPLSFFEKLANDHELKLTDFSASYNHLRGQRMIRAEK